MAIKELLFDVTEINDMSFSNFLSEIKLMSTLKHKSVVEFIGITLAGGHKISLITELMKMGSLRDVLDKKGDNLPWNVRCKLAKDAAKGMSYLHSRKIIHRDLKPQNLLVNSEPNWECKITDFGISTIRPDVTRTMTCIGTPVYMAPEVLQKNKYSEKADVYSFGIVLVELFTGKYPYTEEEFGSLNQIQLVFQICQNEARPSTASLPASLQQLIFDCWNRNTTLRPSFMEIIARLRRIEEFEAKNSTLSSTGSSSSSIPLSPTAKNPLKRGASIARSALSDEYSISMSSYDSASSSFFDS